MQNNPLQEKAFHFAIKIILLCKRLDQQKSFEISRQLLRSGTSVGANIEEAIQAQSKPDFISKLSISLKEAAETEFWLKLIKATNLIAFDSDQLIRDIKEIQKILTASIKTAKLRQGR